MPRIVRIECASRAGFCLWDDSAGVATLVCGASNIDHLCEFLKLEFGDHIGIESEERTFAEQLPPVADATGNTGNIARMVGRMVKRA